ncbi:hypothetical protein CRUP_021679, partial [Coryphaenoides rupestris]
MAVCTRSTPSSSSILNSSSGIRHSVWNSGGSRDSTRGKLLSSKPPISRRRGRSLDGWPLDRGLLYSIETLVVQWSCQIWTILKKDSGAALQDHPPPGPMVELHFWATQRDNLLGIQAQIQSPKVEQIMEILRS